MASPLVTLTTEPKTITQTHLDAVHRLLLTSHSHKDLLTCFPVISHCKQPWLCRWGFFWSFSLPSCRHHHLLAAPLGKLQDRPHHRPLADLESLVSDQLFSSTHRCGFLSIDKATHSSLADVCIFSLLLSPLNRIFVRCCLLLLAPASQPRHETNYYPSTCKQLHSAS